MTPRQKYKVIPSFAAEFGPNAKHYAIFKKTIFGFYWETDEMFLRKETAQKRCDELNKQYKEEQK